MPKAKTINVTGVWDIQIEIGEGEFILVFGSSDYTIKVHLERHCVGLIASRLWNFIKAERASVDRQINHLRDERRD